MRPISRALYLLLAVVITSACSGSPTTGYVVLTQNRDSRFPVSHYTLAAEFEGVRVPDFAAGTADGFRVLNAEAGCLVTDGGGPSHFFDSGTMHASVDGMELVSASAPRSDTSTYSVQDADTIDPGTSVTLSVDGGPQVLANEATLVEPAPPGIDLPTDLPRDRDLTLTWSPDLDADSVDVRLSRLHCQVPVSAGSLTITQRMLALLEAGDQIMRVAAYRQTTRDVDGIETLYILGNEIEARVTVR